MKSMDLRSWNYSENLEGLLFFVQRIYELTADTTDFLEKEVRLASCEIVKEILDLIRVHETMKLGSFEVEISCLKEELIHALKMDEVGSILIGPKIDRYVATLSTPNNTEGIKQAMEVMLLRLDSGQYLKKMETCLLESVQDYKKKDRIFLLCNRLFEVLLNCGYQKGTIQHLVNVQFFDRSGKTRVDSLNSLREFLRKFDLEKSEYEVVFKGSRVFDEIKESCERFNVQLLDHLEAVYEKSFEVKFLRNSGKRFTYIKCSKVRAVDYLHAKKVAGDKMALLSDLFVVFHHRKKPWFSDECLIYNRSKNHVVGSGKSLNPMAKGRLPDVTDVSSVFNIFVKNFGLQKDSFRRFSRVVEIHSQALENNETSSQILSLWICLESLLVTGRKGSHLAMVKNPIVDISFNNQIKNIISSLSDSLVDWNGERFDKALSGVTTELALDKYQRFCEILSLSEYEAIAVELLGELNIQPVIRYKMGRLIRLLQSVSGIEKYLVDLKNRVEWDIQRIYRSRNKIVHQGDVSNHSELLVETAHHYLDLVISSIIHGKLIGRNINSVDNLVFEEALVSIEREAVLKNIKEIGLNNNNIRSLVYGNDILEA